MGRNPSNAPQLLEKYYRPLKIILSVVLLFGSGLLLAKTLEYRKRPKLSYQEKTLPQNTTSSESSETATRDSVTSLKVDVSGSVAAPGVYSLSTGERIEDALDAAGGLSPEADTAWVAKELNLAAKLSDGDKIYIPAEGEHTVTETITQPVARAGSTAGSSSEDSGCPAKININNASKEVLQCLYNVGEARAQAIIDYRSQKPFDSVGEITNIKGIGEKTLEKIRGKIVVR